MLGIACLLIAVAPQEWFSLQVGDDSYFFVSWGVAGLFAASATAHYIAGSWRLPWPAIRVLWPFGLFVLLGGISLATSPYLSQALSKGMVQVIGISAMVAMALGFCSLVANRPPVLPLLLKWNAVTCGVVGIIGIVQFVVNNVARAPILTPDFLATFLGWDHFSQAGQLGGLLRATSVETEPAHLCTFLAAAAGLALVRLGLAGRTAALNLRPHVPGWAAYGIIGGFGVSLSLEGYLTLIVAAIATASLARQGRKLPQRTRGRRYASLVGAAALVTVIAVPIVAGPALIEKAGTLSLIYQALDPEAADIKDVDTGDISALAIAGNAVVALRNLEERPFLGMGFGGHPVSYDELVPDFAFYSADALYGLNKANGASLLIRILSETGILGTLAFLAGAISVLGEGWATCRRCAKAPVGDRLVKLRGLSIAVTASCAAILFAYLSRKGDYFDAAMWECIAMTLSLTSLVPSERTVRVPLMDTPNAPPAPIPT